MDWRIKCVALHALALAPRLQRIAERVTGSANLAVTDSYLKLHRSHAETYRRVHPGRALEFGGGRHFLSPLMLSQAGATEVLVYDLERLTSPEQINHTICQLKGRVDGEWPEIADFDDLHRRYRIRYLAPADARNTGLPAAFSRNVPGSRGPVRYGAMRCTTWTTTAMQIGQSRSSTSTVTPRASGAG